VIIAAQVFLSPKITNHPFPGDPEIFPGGGDFGGFFAPVEESYSDGAILQLPFPDFQEALFGYAPAGFPERILVDLMISSLVRTLRVNSSSLVISPLKIKGAATMAQSDIWVYCSLGERGVGAVSPFQLLR
jgi:hypothetical protein